MGQSIKLIGIIFFVILFNTNTGFSSNAESEIKFYPVKHATMVIQSKDITIYVDPVGEVEAFEKYSKPDFILITDIHKDHLSRDLVDKLKKADTFIIGPNAVVEQLANGTILNNGESLTHKEIKIQAIAAYNLTNDRKKYHPKGRGNGYLLTISDKRIYISGDTEDIPEMRMLKDIDYAFVCMNLPYTMTEDQAASAVLEFKPKIIMPYHFRGKNGFSDIEKFKKKVEKDGNIKVVELDWY